jgi:multiple sugar transport system substrate-binding protein
MKRILRIWLMTSNYTEELPILTKTFQNLEKEYQIKIDFKVVIWVRAYDELIDAFKNGQGPDIFVLGSTWVSTFHHLGYLAEVPSSFKKRKNLAKWSDECGCFEGKQYSIPWFVEPLLLLGNENLINKYYGQIPYEMNWQQFKNICDHIDYSSNKNTNLESLHVPFSFIAKGDMMTLHYFTAWLYKRGFSYPEIHKAQSRFINSEEFLKTFRYITDLVSYKTFDISDPNLYANLFYDKFYKKGQSSFLLDSATRITSETLRDLKCKGKASHPYSIYPIPSENSSMPTWAGGGFLSVSSTSQYKEEAWSVIDSLMKDDFLEEWCMASGYMPAFEAEPWHKYSDNPFLCALKKEIINSRNYPFHPLWRNIEKILHQGLSKLFWQFWFKKHTLNDELIIEIEKEINDKINNILSLTWGMR